MSLQPQAHVMAKKRVACYPFETKDLIKEVLKRPALWQPHHADFTNRYMRAEHWRDIAAVLIPEFGQSKEKVRLVASVASRWKTARMGLIRNMRLGQSYMYHNEMSFLVPILKDTLAEERLKRVTIRAGSEELPQQSRPTRGRPRKATEQVASMRLRLRSTAPDTTCQLSLGAKGSPSTSKRSTITIRTTPSTMRSVLMAGHNVTSTSTTPTAAAPTRERVTTTTTTTTPTAATDKQPPQQPTPKQTTTTTTTPTTASTLRAIPKRSPPPTPSSSSHSTTTAPQTVQTTTTTTPTAREPSPPPADEPLVANEPVVDQAEDMEFGHDGDQLAKVEVISICSDLSDELDLKLLAQTPFRNLHPFNGVGSTTPPQTVVHGYEARDDSLTQPQEEFLLAQRRNSTSSCSTSNLPTTSHQTPLTTEPSNSGSSTASMPRDSGCGSSASSLVMSVTAGRPSRISLAAESTSTGDLRGFGEASGSGPSGGVMPNPATTHTSEDPMAVGQERFSFGQGSNAPFGNNSSFMGGFRGNVSLDSSSGHNDPDQAFFDSIKPIIRNWSVDKKLDFQFEVLGLLKNFRGQQ